MTCIFGLFMFLLYKFQIIIGIILLTGIITLFSVVWHAKQVILWKRKRKTIIPNNEMKHLIRFIVVMSIVTGIGITWITILPPLFEYSMLHPWLYYIFNIMSIIGIILISIIIWFATSSTENKDKPHNEI